MLLCLLAELIHLKHLSDSSILAIQLLVDGFGEWETQIWSSALLTLLYEFKIFQQCMIATYTKK